MNQSERSRPRSKNERQVAIEQQRWITNKIAALDAQIGALQAKREQAIAAAGDDQATIAQIRLEYLPRLAPLARELLHWMIERDNQVDSASPDEPLHMLDN
jgi:ribonuclease HI